jgi:hypothetical protein
MGLTTRRAGFWVTQDGPQNGIKLVIQIVEIFLLDGRELVALPGRPLVVGHNGQTVSWARAAGAFHGWQTTKQIERRPCVFVFPTHLFIKQYKSHASQRTEQARHRAS